MRYLLLFRFCCLFSLWVNAPCQYREFFGTFLPRVSK